MKTILTVAISLLAILALVISSFPSPYLTDLDPTIEKNKVSYNSSFILHFSQKMDQESVEKNFKLLPAVEGDFKWTDGKTVQFQPQKPLKIGDEYQLNLSKNAKSIWRKEMGIDTHLDYVVTGPPFVLFHDPAEKSLIKNGTPITVMFDRAMTLKDIPKEKLFQISPPVKGKIKLMGQSAFQFLPEKLSPGQDYTITLPAGIPSQEGGQTEKIESWTVRNPKNRVLQSLPEEGGTTNPDGQLQIRFENPIDLGQIKPGKNALLFPSNDLKVEGEVAKEDGFFNTEVRYGQNEKGEKMENILIFKPEFPYQTDEPEQFILKADPALGLEEDFALNFVPTQKSDLEGVKETQAQNTLAWEGGEQLQFFVQGENPVLRLKYPLQKETVLSLCQIPSNEYIRTQAEGGFENYSCPEDGVTLQPEKDQPLTALDLNEYMEREWINGVYFVSLKTDTEKIQLIFLIQDSALMLKHSHQDLLVWASDIRSGNPLSGVDVEFLSQEGMVLKTGTTDKDGVVLNKLGLTSGVWARIKTSEENADFQPWALVHNSWYDRESEQAVGVKKGKILYLANQNQFQPGETLVLKGIYQDESTLPPNDTPTRALKLNLLDDSGELFLSQTASLSDEGALEGKIHLPFHLPVGNYNVIAQDETGVILGDPFPLKITSGFQKINFEWSSQQRFYGDSISSLNLKARGENGLALPNLKANYQLFMENSMCEPECFGHDMIETGDVSFNLNGEGKIELKDTNNPFFLPGNAYRLEIKSAGEADGENAPTIFDFKVAQGEYALSMDLRHAFLESGESIEGDLLYSSPQVTAPEIQTIEISLIDPKDRDQTLSEKKMNIKKNESTLFTFPVGENIAEGVYRLRAKMEDSLKNTIVSEQEIYVINKMKAPLASNFFMAVDQQHYQVGGRADVILHEKEASPAHPVRTLVTYERNGILNHQVFNLTAPVTMLKIPLESAMAPYFEVKATTLTAGDLPGFEQQVKKIQVEDEGSTIKLALSMEPENPKPGSTVKLTVKSVDHKNQPVSAHVSLNVGEGETNVPLLNYRDFFASASSGNESANIPLENPAETSGGSWLEHSWPLVEKTFKAYFFRPDLQTDNSGTVTIDMPYPKEGSDFHFYLTAFTEGQRSGFKAGRLNPGEKLSVQEILPSFVMAGDQTTFGVRVQNISHEAVNTTIKLNAEGVSFKGEKTQSLNLQPGEKTEIFFPVLVNPTINKKNLILSFEWDGKSLEVNVPVKHLTAFKDLAENGVVNQLWAGRVNFSDDAYEKTGWVNFSLSAFPLLGSTLFKNKWQLEEDQSAYSLYVKSTDQLLNLNPDKAEDKAELGVLLNTLTKKANADGAYFYWNPGFPDGKLTAKILATLGRAKKSGIDVEEATVNGSVNYLLNELNQVEMPVSEQLLLLWALGENGQYDTERNLTLFKVREEMTIMEKGFLLLNLVQLKQAGQGGIEPFIEKLRAELRSEAVKQEDMLYFVPRENKVLSTALMLYAFEQSGAEPTEMQSMVHYLFRQKTDWSKNFDPEQELWKRMALKAFSKTFSPDPSGFIAQVKINGKTVVDQSMNAKENQKITEKTQEVSDLNKKELNDLLVIKNGRGDLYFDAQLISYLNPELSQEIEEGAVLTRTIQGSAPLKKGDSYTVHLELIVPQDLKEVMIESLNAAGMRTIKASDPRLNSPFDHVELTEQGIRFLATELPAGVYDFDYEVQAILEGSYHLLPATFKSLEDRMTYAQTRGGVVNITN